jgi:hypothetical protein
MKKLYCYVDESGQDAKGKFFVVSLVIVEDERDSILSELENIELKSGKKRIKWHRARPKFRDHYIDALAVSDLLKNKIYFDTFTNSKQYIKMTSYATARAIIKKSHEQKYTVSVYVDGFKRQEVVLFSRILSELNIKRRKVMGVKRDENNAFIRLADAVCGLIRDAEDGNESAKHALKRLTKKGIVHAL